MDHLKYEELLSIYRQAKQYKLDPEFISLLEKMIREKEKRTAVKAVVSYTG